MDKFYDKEVVDSLCDKVRQTLNKMFESYSLFLSKGQVESDAQEIEQSEFVTSSGHAHNDCTRTANGASRPETVEYD